jgi:hypothetical protein
MAVRVELSGPIFDVRGEHEVEAFVTRALDEVSRQGYSNVMTNLNASIKHPTPYYETQITVHEDGAEKRVVTDRGVIYGHWLEGDGSRNFPKTRFRGYASFRRGAQTLAGQVKALAEHVLPPYLDRMNH